MVFKLQAKLVMNEEVLFYSLVSTLFDISFTSGIIIFHIFLNILIMGNSSKHQREKKTEKTEENQREEGRTSLFTTYPNSSLCISFGEQSWEAG